jgi:hypothetical protein
MHEQQSRQPPRGAITSDQGASQRDATHGQAQSQGSILQGRYTTHHALASYQLSPGGAYIQGRGAPEHAVRRVE